MKKLTKTEWTLLIVGLVSMIFTTLLSGAVQLGANAIAIITLLKFAWEKYLSFSQNQAMNIAENVQSEIGDVESRAKKPYTFKDLIRLAKD